MLPKVRMPSFLLSVPFKWIAMERKSRLKIKSVAVAAILTKRKEMIKHSVIASKKRGITKRLLSNFICLLSFPVQILLCREIAYKVEL